MEIVMLSEEVYDNVYFVLKQDVMKTLKKILNGFCTKEITVLEFSHMLRDLSCDAEALFNRCASKRRPKKEIKRPSETKKLSEQEAADLMNSLTNEEWLKYMDDQIKSV